MLSIAQYVARIKTYLIKNDLKSAKEAIGHYYVNFSTRKEPIRSEFIIGAHVLLQYCVSHPAYNEVTTLLLLKGAHPAYPDNNGNTAVHLALLSKNTGILGDLIKKLSRKEQAELLSKPNNERLTPFHLAAIHNVPEALQLFLKTPLSINHSIAHRKRWNNKNYPLNQGWSAAHAAAYHGASEGLALLITGNVALDQPDALGNLPLHLALMQGHSEAAIQLISAAPDTLQICNAAGQSPAAHLERQNQTTMAPLMQWLQQQLQLLEGLQISFPIIKDNISPVQGEGALKEATSFIRQPSLTTNSSTDGAVRQRVPTTIGTSLMPEAAVDSQTQTSPNSSIERLLIPAPILVTASSQYTAAVVSDASNTQGRWHARLRTLPLGLLLGFCCAIACLCYPLSAKPLEKAWQAFKVHVLAPWNLPSAPPIFVEEHVPTRYTSPRATSPATPRTLHKTPDLSACSPLMRPF